jgi:hypothetical protein
MKLRYPLPTVIVATLALLCSGCTTLRPTEVPPDRLQHMIAHERLFEAGDRVRLVTAEGEVYKFRVTQLDLAEGVVVGRDHAVPIEDIVAVETREVSVGKTAALVGGLAAVRVLLLSMAAAGFILAAGA